MKKSLLLLSVLLSSQSFSQTQIAVNEPVYIKNQILYVGQNIKLASNSNLYLQNNSQLIQGTHETSENTGKGTVSVYLKGTSGNFYNKYWRSPIGNTLVSTDDNNLGIALLYHPKTTTDSTLPTILPIGSYNGITNPLTMESHWIYKLRNTNNYSQCEQLGASILIAPGKGFTMKVASGSNNLSQFEKPAKKLTTKTNNDGNGDNYDGPPPPPPLIPYFKLNTIINNEFTRQLTLVFASEATDGIDKDIDVKNMDGDYPQDISFWIEDGDYVIQGLNFNLSKKIPLTVKAAVSTKFKFYISENDGFDTQPIYIYDALDMSFHDIRNTPYQVLVAAGKDTERFKISFTNNETLGTSNVVRSNFFISQDNKHQVLNAINANNRTMKSFELYNILGKSVISKDNLGPEQIFSFSTSELSDGVYIAIFIAADGAKITKKIIISNSGN